NNWVINHCSYYASGYNPSWPEDIRGDTQDIGEAAKRHRGAKLVSQNAHDLRDSAGTPHCQSPYVRPSDQHRARAQSEGLQHVGAAANAPVEQHGYAPVDGFGHAGQRLNRGGQGIKVTPAVIGNDDACRAMID